MRTLEKSYAKCPAYAIDVYNALIALEGIESIHLYNNTETFNLVSSIIVGKTRNLNVKKMIMISRMLDDVITHNKQVEKQLNNKLDEIINNMTLKKIVKKHVAVRANWIKGKIKHKQSNENI